MNADQRRYNKTTPTAEAHFILETGSAEFFSSASIPVHLRFELE
jgi:hypothetical protein